MSSPPATSRLIAILVLALALPAIAIIETSVINAAFGLATVLLLTLFLLAVVHINKSYTNPVVITRKTEHPGWEEFAVNATREELVALAESIVAQGKKGEISFGIAASLGSEKTGYFKLIFQSRPPEEIRQIQQLSTKTAAWRYAIFVPIFVILALATFGAYSLIR